MKKTALVLGGSGFVGQHLIKLLLQDKKWDNILAVTRRSLKLPSEKVTEIIADSSNIEQAAKQLSCDTVFCCLGTTQKKAGSRENFRKIDHDYVLQCAKIAHQQGAQRFIVISSIGANVSSLSYYLRVKGETEQDLKALGFESLDILRPSVIVGDRSEIRFAEKIGALVLSWFRFLLIGPLKNYHPIDGKHVAQAMLRIASQSAKGVTVYPSQTLQSLATDYTKED